MNIESLVTNRKTHRIVAELLVLLLTADLLPATVEFATK